jgi:hypothetical protein
MPSTLWAAPVPNLNTASLTISTFTTATKTDLSPQNVVLWPGMLSLGTRIRLRAYGVYTASTTASALTFGFYMNSTATGNIATTPAILGETASTAAVVLTAAPWFLEWDGQVRQLTQSAGASPGPGAIAASVMGQGKSYLPATLTTFTQGIIPQTAAARTVAQTATGLVTNIAQTVMVGITVATNTGFTSCTCDELTCELLG